MFSSHLFSVCLSFSLLVQCAVGSSLHVLLILLCAQTISVCVFSQGPMAHKTLMATILLSIIRFPATETFCDLVCTTPNLTDNHHKPLPVWLSKATWHHEETRQAWKWLEKKITTNMAKAQEPPRPWQGGGVTPGWQGRRGEERRRWVGVSWASWGGGGGGEPRAGEGGWGTLSVVFNKILTGLWTFNFVKVKVKSSTLVYCLLFAEFNMFLDSQSGASCTVM